MSKTENKYIKKARRKRLIKRMIIMAILAIAISSFIIFKTEIFLIKNIKCGGENVVTKEYVLNTTDYLFKSNIFTVNKDELTLKLKENPYVKSVSIDKKLPNTLTITVKEAKGLFYIKNNGVMSIISSDLILLENTPESDMPDLIEITGVDISDKEVGDTISNDTRMKHILEEFYDEQGIIKANNEEFAIKSINLEDLSKIKVYLNNIEVQLGSDENLRQKMSNAILVYKTNLPKEYINVSFNGTPDFK